MVGPTQTNVSRLTASNILFVGPHKHEEIPHYIKRFHVGLIPYVINEYTTYIYPAKLNEYLAMGIPVVATDLAEIQHFNTEHHNVIAVARNSDEFVHAIQEALRNGSVEASRRRIEVARQNDWEVRIAQMSARIEERLISRRQTREGWQEALRRLYRVAHRRILRTAAVVTVLYLLLFRSQLVWWLAEPLRLAEPPHHADAIVVFAGGVGESGKAGGGYQERVKYAVDLYRAGFAPRMVFSSGYTFVFQEAEVMKALAIDQGVPPSAILLETTAANTFWNVRFVTAMLRRAGWRSMLLVSSPYHMRRATWTFRTQAPEIRVIPTPVPRSQFYVHGPGANLEQARAIAQEYAAILVYWWKGWLKP